VRIEATAIPDVWTVDIEPIVDERGMFARTFCADEVAAAGLDPVVAQTSISVNDEPGTLRGMHLQREPYGEAKLVRCTLGRIFDVAVDARPDSPTFAHWHGWELSQSNHRALYLGPGIAHGFFTLEPGSEVLYQMSVPHRADASAGFRWDDPAVGIEWPGAPVVMSARDRGLPTLAVMADPSGAERTTFGP
jgi:dTDP-4-dehydrorhamnose 3,5-epimerase